MEPAPPPTSEGDTDLAALTEILPPGDWRRVEPGTLDWEEAEKAGTSNFADSFPKEVEEPLRGLMFLGSLQRDFSLLGHDFVIRTLKIGEELSCALVVKEYEETLGHAKAFATAFVSAAIVSVDGQRMIQPLGPEQTLSVIRERFDYVRNNWYWPVIEQVYDEYSELLLAQAKVFEAVEGNSSASRATF